MKSTRRFIVTLLLTTLVISLISAGTPAQSSATSSDPMGNIAGVKKGVDSITAEEFREQLAWWAHDDRGGREPGTPGNIEAGDAAAAEFKRLGLEPYGDMGKDGHRTFFQYFDRGGKFGFHPKDVQLTAGNRSWILGKDYTQASWTKESDFKNLPVVFAGYGIVSRTLDYNDYAGMDVKDKAILIFNHEPQEKNPQSRWYGTRRTPEATLSRKVRNAAFRRGVKLILMVDGPLHHDPARDQLTPKKSSFRRFCPVLHIRRAVAEALLEGSGKTLEGLQKAIDENDAPASMPLKTRISFKARYALVKPARNILALFRGSSPKLQDEVIIVGAHYDHIGVGMYGSASPSRRGEIHNGADDNATGSVGVLELAEAFAESGVKTKRSILFMLFDAEEKGLLGSFHYVAHPLVPLDKTAAMMNMDMIGHVRNNKMSVGGTGTCAAWEKILKKAEHGSPLIWRHGRSASGGSDHLAFVRKRIPVLMYHSGMNPYYHSPDDDAFRCNPLGAQEVLRTLFRTLVLAANLDRKPVWTNYRSSVASNRLNLGVRVRSHKKGARVVKVTASTPGARAGLKAGDIIIRIGDSPVRNRFGLSRALRKVKWGQSVEMEFLRGTKKMNVTAHFPKRKKPGVKKPEPRIKKKKVI